jgi:phenylacetate-CoA ligase
MSDLWAPWAKHLLFPLQAAWERSSAPRHLSFLEKSQFWTPQQLADHQFRALGELVAYAYDHCPFYRRRFDECGFDPGRFQDPADLLVIPVLTKEDIQRHGAEMVSDQHPVATLMPNKTGGSTGKPLEFYVDPERFFSRTAATMRHDRWAGWDIGRKKASIWGHRGDQAPPSSLLYRLRSWALDRTLVLDSSSITAEKLDGFRRRLLEFRPEIYIAYANSVFLYARYLEESGASAYHRPGAIITSAEVLDEDRRATIERVFGCPVLNRYGSRETSVMASQCRQREGLHICAEALYLEFLAGGKPVAPGESGRIVVTDLWSRGMPFIRYDIADVGSPRAGTCSCGRGLPMMDISGGRVTDFLVTPEGKIISGASLTIYLIANAPGVAQAQLVQHSPERVTFKVVRAEGFGQASLDFFAAEVPRFFGPEVAYDLEFVDEIPVEASGKYRFSVSQVDPTALF